MILRALQLVEVVGKLWHLHLHILAFPACQYQFLQFSFLHRIARNVFPVVENTLWERLSAGLLAESRHKSERLCDWQVSLHLNKRSSLTRILLKHAATPQIHARIHSTHGLLWTCDLNQEN